MPSASQLAHALAARADPVTLRHPAQSACRSATRRRPPTYRGSAHKPRHLVRNSNPSILSSSPPRVNWRPPDGAFSSLWTYDTFRKSMAPVRRVRRRVLINNRRSVGPLLAGPIAATVEQGYAKPLPFPGLAELNATRHSLYA